MAADPLGARLTATAGALVSPAGAFIRGTNAYTSTVDSITVPDPGQTVTVLVKDPNWIVPGQMVYIGGAGPGGTASAFVVTAVNGSQLTLLNPLPPDLTFSGDYSTTERVTGATWIDGRTVYQKSYETTTTPGAVTGEQPFVTLPLAIADFDLVIEMSAILSAGPTWQIKLPYTDDHGWAQIAIGQEPPATGVIWIWQDRWDKSNPLDTTPGVFAQNLPCFITLKYVKDV